jgi:putative ABC transport system substrate-binding protein
MKGWTRIALLAAVTLAPHQACAQASSTPVIGFLHPGSPDRFGDMVAAYRQGLGEHGFVENKNLKIEFRWAEGHNSRLPELAADLVHRGVSLLTVPGGSFAALAAKAATKTIPILFIAGPDPVDVGLVSSIARPGTNATGVAIESTSMLAKRMEILRQLIPEDAKVAMVMSPSFTVAKFENQFADSNELIRIQIDAGKLGDPKEYDEKFAAAVKAGARGLIVTTNPNLTAHHKLIVQLAEKYSLPAVYPWRQYVTAGGLASYGPSLVEAYRQLGRYAGRILKGATPDTMPVESPNTFELTLNLKTANKLGLEIPYSLIAVADEKIE